MNCVALASRAFLLIVLIFLQGFVDSSDNLYEVTAFKSVSEFDPPIQRIASKFFEACLNRNINIMENVLTLFANRLSDRQIEHAIYLIISKASIDAIGHADPQTIQFLSVLVRKLQEANRKPLTEAYRKLDYNPNGALWTKTFLWTDDMLDVFFIENGAVKSKCWSIQDVISKSIKIYNVKILNYFRKRGALHITTEMADDLLMNCEEITPDIELSLFILERHPEKASSNLIWNLMRKIRTSESLERIIVLISQDSLSKNMYPHIIENSDKVIFESALQTGNLADTPDTFLLAVSNPNIPEESFQLFCDYFKINIATYLQKDFEWARALKTIPLLRLTSLIESFARSIPKVMDSFLKSAVYALPNISNVDVAMFVLHELKYSCESLRIFIQFATLKKQRKQIMQKRILRLIGTIKNSELLRIFDGSENDPLIYAIHKGRIDLVEVLLDFLIDLRDSCEHKLEQINAQSNFGIEMLPENLYDRFTLIYKIIFPLNPKNLRNMDLANYMVLQSLFGDSRIELFNPEGEASDEVIDIVKNVIPMAIRCRFDWWLIESLRFFA